MDKETVRCLDFILSHYNNTIYTPLSINRVFQNVKAICPLSRSSSLTELIRMNKIVKNSKG